MVWLRVGAEIDLVFWAGWLDTGVSVNGGHCYWLFFIAYILMLGLLLLRLMLICI